MAALEKIEVWKNRANLAFITLTKKDGELLTADEMAAITKVGIKYSGKYYNSDDQPTAFDLTTYAADSKIGVRLGLTDMPLGSDPSELIIYDAASPAGVVWMQIAIKVRGDAMIA